MRREGSLRIFHTRYCTVYPTLALPSKWATCFVDDVILVACVFSNQLGIEVSGREDAFCGCDSLAHLPLTGNACICILARCNSQSGGGLPLTSSHVACQLNRTERRSLPDCRSLCDLNDGWTCKSRSACRLCHCCCSHLICSKELSLFEVSDSHLCCLGTSACQPWKPSSNNNQPRTYSSPLIIQRIRFGRTIIKCWYIR